MRDNTGTCHSGAIVRRMRRATAATVSVMVLLTACTDDPKAQYASVPTTAAVVEASTAPSTAVIAPGQTDATTTTTIAASDAAPHVFVIVLENTTYDQAFGSAAVSDYLASELPAMGMLLTQYYGTAHPSLPNYIAMISGQAPNPDTHGNCQDYTDFMDRGMGEYGQALGRGCVYPTSVPMIGDQLTAAGLTWRAYGEDMAARPDEAPTACRHPVLGQPDADQHQKPGDAYATRHMPFLYFHSVIDSPDCAERVVDLGRLDADLALLSTTPNLVYVVPDLCNDAHDETCLDGGLGGLTAADAFLRTWVPKVLASPAFADNGLLVITFDESESGADASGCCGELQGPNQSEPAGKTGPGGGRTGTVLIGPAITPGSVNDTPYNHFSLLCSLEDLWGLEHIGFAGHPSTPCFGADVYGAGA